MTSSTALFSTLTLPHHHPLSTKHFQSFVSTKSCQPPLLSTKSPLILLPRASSSTPTLPNQEEEDSSTTSDSFSDQPQPINSIPIGGCKGCGKAEMEKGCNGEGRIQGGIATVPGFGWWPIKAYRPCPGFVATGGRYRRQGQSMDEVAGFGSVPRKSVETTTTKVAATTGAETRSSEKKEGPRKFKR